MNPSLSPPFHELDEYIFQNFCRDLFAKQENIATCDVYGKRGQGQRGIDLLAKRRDNSELEVGQCKCYQHFSDSKIREASDEFFKFLDFWKDKNLKRYILFTACDLDNTKQQDEIIVQTQRFASVGITYEAWGANTIRTKVASHPDVVRLHVQSEDWVKQICGDVVTHTRAQESGSGTAIAIEMLGSEIVQLSTELSKEKEIRLDEIREKYRKGYHCQALAEVEAFIQDANWPRLESPLRARALRVLATYTLNLESQISKARALVDEARSLDPEFDDSLLKTLIVYHEEGATAALDEILNTPSIDLFNFQLALLLELSKYDELILKIVNIPPNLIVNPETLRLHAWALVCKGELINAKRQIQIALEEQPSWQSVRFLAAIIDYLCVLSPAVYPSRPIIKPEPVDWSFVKRDLESLNQLRVAEGMFKSLAETAEPEEQWGHIFTSWRLACLANDSGRQSDAESFCKTLLLKDPNNSMALIWGLSRGFNLDWESSRTALESYPKESADYIDKVIALLALYLNKGDSESALRLLAESKRSFEEKHGLDIWVFWQVQTQVANSRPEEALITAKSFSKSEERLFLEAMALRAIATQTNEWEELVTHLDNCFKETGEGRFLLEYCHVQGMRKVWPAVADKAEQLMTKIGTQDALRFAAQGTWEAKQVDKCLKLLTNYSHLYPSSILPHDLWQLKVLCQAKIGQLSQAVEEALDLARHEPTTMNLLTLMDVQLMKGDLKGLSLTANRLFSHEDVLPKDLLRLGRLVIFENLELARKAWKRAIGLGIDDSELGFAMDLGYSLSLDRELGPLWQRANELNAEGKGPFRPVGFSELKAWIQEKNQNRSFIYQKYNSAEIPIHFFAERLNIGLSYLLRTLFKENCREPDPELKPVILLRHGGRALSEKFSNSYSIGRLHLDITSFFLAAELGILDKIEECFKPIRISKHLPTALVFERDRLTAQQPAVLEGYRRIQELLGVSKLHPTPSSSAINTTLYELTPKMGQYWLALLTSTLGKNSFLVEFLPLKSNDGNIEPIQLSPIFTEKITTCRMVVESLHRYGHLSDLSYQTVLSDMGNEGTLEPEAMLPAPGDTIFFMANTVSILSNAKILQDVCEHFKVFVEESFLKEIQNLIHQDEHRIELAMWLETLLDRVQSGLENGTYESFQCEGELSGLSLHADLINDFTSRSLLELLRFSPKNGDVICVDDRFTNAFAHRDSMPVVSLLELIEVLRINQKITQSEIFEIYLRLRVANVRYIPLRSKEIIFHLEQTQIVDGFLVETSELSILRKYLASCLLDAKRLQRPPDMPSGAPNPQGELAFILGSLRAVRNSIIECWRKSDSNSMVSKIRANWILENLYTGVFGIRHLCPGIDSDSDGLDLIGMDIGGAFSEGISLGGREGEQGDGKSPRQQYFAWLENRILRPRLLSEPGAKAAIAKVVHHFIAALRETEASSPVHELQQKALIQQMYLDIPEIIKDEMKSDPEFLSYIGVQIVESVEFGNVVFPKSGFWLAAMKAMNNEPNSTEALEPRGNYTFERITQVSSPKGAIRIRREGDSTEFKLEIPLLELLQGAANDWEKLIRADRFLFDCESHELEKIIGEVLTTIDPQLRVEKVQQWYDKSTVVFYAQLEKKIIESGQFKFAELIPPSADRLLAHYRLKPLSENFDFQQVLYEASSRLIHDEGLETAMQRMVCLPVQLSEPILEHFGSLSTSARQQLLSDFAAIKKAPVCLVHLLYLALKFDGKTAWGIDFSRKAVSLLFSPQEGEENYVLFKSLLSWVNDEFSCWADVKEWLPSVKLAMIWAHASNLYNIFQRTGTKPGELAKYFDPKRLRMPSEFLDRDLDCWNNVLHPNRLNRTAFLIHSLAKILNGFDVELLRQASIFEKFQEVADKTKFAQSYEELLLLRDSTLGQDNLASFLGGDRWKYLNEILNSEEIQTFLSPSLFSLTESSLHSLIENSHAGHDWLKLAAFIGDLPIYPELKPKLKTLLKKINLEEIYDNDPQAAVLALLFSSDQALYALDESEKSALIEKVLKFCQKIDKRFAEGFQNQPSGSQNPHEKIIFLAYEAILNLSIIPSDPRKTSRTFSGLLQKLSEVAPNFINIFRPALNKFAFELPSSQLHGLWPIILLARARSRG